MGKGTVTSSANPLAQPISCDMTVNGFKPTNSYVLGLSGEQLTETDSQGNWKHMNVFAAASLIATYDIAPNGSAALHFHLSDWLATRHVQTDMFGNPESTFTSLPFGDAFAEISVSGAPPTADDAREHHFTGKERDTESGLNYFSARYYASSMGRWMSPDWSKYPDPCFGVCLAMKCVSATGRTQWYRDLAAVSKREAICG